MTTATIAMKEALQQVKVYKAGAAEFEMKLNQEAFHRWNEKCEVMKTSKIRSGRIEQFFDHLKNTYEGINDEMRKQLSSSTFSDDTMLKKIIEWKFSSTDGMGARYAIVAIGKSSDGEYYDFAYALYKLDFEVGSKQAVSRHLSSCSYLWGLYSWATATDSTERRTYTLKEIKTYKNYFRLKAMEAFCEEGLCDRINYARSLDEIPED